MSLGRISGFCLGFFCFVLFSNFFLKSWWEEEKKKKTKLQNVFVSLQMSLHCPHHMDKKKNGGNYIFHTFVNMNSEFHLSHVLPIYKARRLYLSYCFYVKLEMSMSYTAWDSPGLCLFLLVIGVPFKHQKIWSPLVWKTRLKLIGIMEK